MPRPFPLSQITASYIHTFRRSLLAHSTGPRHVPPTSLLSFRASPALNRLETSRASCLNLIPVPKEYVSNQISQRKRRSLLITHHPSLSSYFHSPVFRRHHSSLFQVRPGLTLALTPGTGPVFHNSFTTHMDPINQCPPVPYAVPRARFYMTDDG